MSEGLPIVVLEAISFGAPVLASDIPENKEIIGENKFGLLFKNKSLADLQDKLIYLLNHQIEAQARASAGLELVKENYNWTKIIAQVDSVYQSLV